MIRDRRIDRPWKGQHCLASSAGCSNGKTTTDDEDPTNFFISCCHNDMVVES